MRNHQIHNRVFDTREEAEEARRVFMRAFPPQGYGSAVIMKKTEDHKWNCEFRRYLSYD